MAGDVGAGRAVAVDGVVDRVGVREPLDPLAALRIDIWACVCAPPQNSKSEHQLVRKSYYR